MHYLEHARKIFIWSVWLFIIAYGFCRFYQWHSQPSYSKPTDIDVIQFGYACTSTNEDDCERAWIVQGKITDFMAGVIESQLQQDGNTLPFCFISKGGEIAATKTILSLLYQYDATVCVGGHYKVNNEVMTLKHYNTSNEVVEGPLCLSACTLLYGAAPNQLMVGMPYIGIHNGERILDFCFCTISLSQSDEPAILDDINDTLINVKDPDRKQGLLDMIYYAATIPNNQMHFLTLPEISTFHLAPTKN